MTPAELGEHVTARIPGSTSATSYDEVTVDVPLQDWATAAAMAANDLDLACDFFDFLSAVDEGDHVTVVTHLYSTARRHHLRLRARVEPGATVPSLTTIFRGADWHERETHEMFGVTFSGDAHRVPLLLPDGFEGAPLRKDFVLASRVAKQWPGIVEPGEAPGDRRPTLPPGVPAAGSWPAPQSADVAPHEAPHE